MIRLEYKIVASMLAVAAIPVIASTIIVDRIVYVSDIVADMQSKGLSQPLRDAADGYRQLFNREKERINLIGQLITLELDEFPEEPLPYAELFKRYPSLGLIKISASDESKAASQYRSPQFKGERLKEFRPKESVFRLKDGRELALTFYVSKTVFRKFEGIGKAQHLVREFNGIRKSMAWSYLYAFLAAFGVIILMSLALSIYIAKRTTRRIYDLAEATKLVSSGDLSVRLNVAGGNDELTDLSKAFNEMVFELGESRERIAYLQTIEAWQEVARRLAHEIKNPLTPIKLAAQQMERAYKGEDEAYKSLQKDCVEIISEEIEGLRRLVHEFSAFSRLPEAKLERTNIADIVDDFMKSHQDLCLKANVSWQTEGLEAYLVDADRMLMKHILFNLVENALHAAYSEKIEDFRVLLSVSVNTRRQSLTLAISDNGRGMDENTVAHIFEPYYTTKETGTGLGLAIVKKIVLDHSGRIWVASKEGEGSTFYMELPFYQE